MTFKFMLNGGPSGEIAKKVENLGGWIVGFAYIIALFGVVLGAILVLGGAARNSSVMPMGFAFIVGSLIQATFIALIGRYAQMRASEVLERK